MGFLEGKIGGLPDARKKPEQDRKQLNSAHLCQSALSNSEHTGEGQVLFVVLAPFFLVLNGCHILLL